MTSHSSSDANFQRSPLYKSLVVLFLLTIAVANTIPNYLSGNYFNKVPGLSSLQELRTLQKSGLTLPGWQTVDQKRVEIGGHKWSIQAIAPQTPPATNPPILLMLRPQTWHRDLPQVDWMDIRGARGWTEDSDRHIQFSMPTQLMPTQSASTQSVLAQSMPTNIEARFLRGWTQERTYAVLQWYAWRNGGNPAPIGWFWAEQGSQLRDRQHMPWVAVSLLIPIQPLSEIESVQSQAEALGQLIQSTLAADVFR